MQPQQATAQPSAPAHLAKPVVRQANLAGQPLHAVASQQRGQPNSLRQVAVAIVCAARGLPPLAALLGGRLTQRHRQGGGAAACRRRQARQWGQQRLCERRIFLLCTRCCSLLGRGEWSGVSARAVVAAACKTACRLMASGPPGAPAHLAVHTLHPLAPLRASRLRPLLAKLVAKLAARPSVCLSYSRPNDTVAAPDRPCGTS